VLFWQEKRGKRTAAISSQREQAGIWRKGEKSISINLLEEHEEKKTRRSSKGGEEVTHKEDVDIKWIRAAFQKAASVTGKKSRTKRTTDPGDTKKALWVRLRIKLSD